MNDEKTTRGPGRPRVYDKPSQKIDAFRKRLDSAGFLRKEVLVRKEVWQEIQTLSKLQGVSVVDAASGLLEHGLQTYLQQANELQRSSEEGRQMSLIQSEMTESIRQTVSGNTASQDEVGDNPIIRFLNKRRESFNDDNN